MMKKQHDTDVIAPAWGQILIFLTYLIVAFFVVYISVIKTYWIIGVVGVGCVVQYTILLFIAGTSYCFTENAIICSFAGIAYRKILWSEIVQIGLSVRGLDPDWMIPSNVEYYIVLTLSGCKLFRPGKDGAEIFLFRHPRRAVIMHARLLYSRIDLIEKYYGPLDYVDERLIRGDAELKKYKYHSDLKMIKRDPPDAQK